MAFKRNAIKWKAQMEEFVDKPYEYVQDNIVRTTYLIFRVLVHCDDIVLESGHCPSFLLQDVAR